MFNGRKYLLQFFAGLIKAGFFGLLRINMEDKIHKISPIKAIVIVLLITGIVAMLWYQFARKTPERIAKEYSSATGWLLVCDTEEHTLSLFKQSIKANPGEWKPILYNCFPCSTGQLVLKDGKMQTCTPKGFSYIHWKERRHSFPEFTSWYNCWIKGGFAIHSTLYAPNEPEPITELDDRLGVDASTSCIRVKIDIAKWMYNNLPVGTPIVVY